MSNSFNNANEDLERSFTRRIIVQATSSDGGSVRRAKGEGVEIGAARDVCTDVIV